MGELVCTKGTMHYMGVHIGTIWRILLSDLYAAVMQLHISYFDQLFRYTLLAEWLTCWTQAQKVLGSNRRSGNSLRQTVHQAAKLVAALLTVAGVTAGFAESNGSLPPGL